MKKSILEVYALAVCFITVVCFVISLGIAIYDVIQIANPEFTLNSYEYKRHQSNDEYWKSYEGNRLQSYEGRRVGESREMQRPSEAELSKQRSESYRLSIESEKRDAFQSLTTASIILVIDVIVFLVHWLIARRARESNIIA